MKKQQQKIKTNRNADRSSESNSMKIFCLAGRAWSKIKLWRQVSEQRTRLTELDDHILKDIGLSRADVEQEAGRYFWDYTSNRDVSLRKRGETMQNENGLTKLKCSNCQC